MPFAESVRSFWMRVAGGQCQARYYTEEEGIVQCMSPADEVHHIIPASQLLVEGLNPNDAVGLPLCRDHHRGLSDEPMFDPDQSFHPDMGQALEDYRAGNKNAFREASELHHELALLGERITNGDWTTDEYYLQGMEMMAVQFLLEHPEEVKPHSNAGLKNIMEPKHWYDLWDNDE